MAQVIQSDTFTRWLKKLKDQQGRRAVFSRIERIASVGYFGDHAGVGDGVSELRIHVGPGYRVYYTIRDEVVVILLCGGDKDSQVRDVARAKEMAAEWE